MTDLIYLMNTLVDKDGKILITDIYKSVAPLTESEKKLYDSIDFDPEAYRCGNSFSICVLYWIFSFIINVLILHN